MISLPILSRMLKSRLEIQFWLSKMKPFNSFVGIAMIIIATPVYAYIGPGSGISLLGGLWAVLVGVVLALAAILFWPIRYLIKRMRARKSAGQPEPASEPADPGSDHESRQ
jgi:hypothetical protein